MHILKTAQIEYLKYCDGFSLFLYYPNPIFNLFKLLVHYHGDVLNTKTALLSWPCAI